ncbi:MAG: tetratricopeptide repeat protein [Chitinophagales bacterium]
MRNLFDQIELYIDERLVGEELVQFEQALETNKLLQKEVEVYRTMIEAVRIQEENQLRRKFAVMDAVLDKELEEEGNGPQTVRQEEPVMGRVITIPVYRTHWFKAAAAIVLLFAAYIIIPSNIEINSKQIAYEKYEVEYKGWKANNLQYSSPSKEHANDDNIEVKEDVANTAQSNTNEVEGTSSIQEYKDANDLFKQGEYKESITVLQQIKDINSQRKNFRLGMAYYADQDLNKAIVNLKKTVEIAEIQISTTDLNTAKWTLGMAYAKQEKTETAIEYFNELTQNDNAYSQKASELVEKMK